MRPSHPPRRRERTRRGWRRARAGSAVVALIAVAVLLVGVAGLGVVRALAQDEAAFEGVTIEVVGIGAPAASPEKQLALRRVTFAPGAALPPHRHPGAVTVSVSSVELAYGLIEGEASVQRAAVDGAAGPVEPLRAGAVAPLGAGDPVYRQGTIAQAANPGREPAVLWVSSLLAADRPFVTVVETVEEPAAAASSEAAAADEAAKPEGTAAAGGATVEGVRATLDEFTFRLSSQIAAGKTTFVITNAGSIYHSVAIVGDGVEAALGSPLEPGETAELTVELPAGTDQIVCPVANHEALGMTRELVVV